MRKKSNGLPVLTRLEIDAIAEKAALSLYPDISQKPRAVDVELFIEQVLGFNYEIHYLSSCACYLGVTIFENVQLPTFNLETLKAQFTPIPANTIIIDGWLVKQAEFDGNEGRCRFTQAHECGHAILHSDYFLNQAKHAFSSNELPNDQDALWAERQADSFAAGFLMPRTAVTRLIKEYRGLGWEDDELIRLMKEVFNVSLSAAFYRLKELGLLETTMEKFNWEALSS